MKKVVKLNIALSAGLFFVLSLFPFSYVDAEKIQSGVTIANPGATTPPAETCQGGVNVMTGEACTAPTGPTAGTCGLQILSGVPINYGQLSLGQDSAEQKVVLKNEGTSQTVAKIMLKGGNWVSDAAGNPTISGPEVTRAAIAPGLTFENKKSLSANGWELGGMAGGQSLTAYFQFRPWVNVPSGSFHQEVTIDLLC